MPVAESKRDSTVYIEKGKAPAVSITWKAGKRDPHMGKEAKRGSRCPGEKEEKGGEDHGGPGAIMKRKKEKWFPDLMRGPTRRNLSDDRRTASRKKKRRTDPSLEGRTDRPSQSRDPSGR